MAIKGIKFTNSGQFKKGHKISKEIRKKMSDAKMGKKRKPFTEEHRKNLSLVQSKPREWARGKKHKTWKLSVEKRIKKSLTMPRGENHYLWKGGVTTTNQQIRHSLEYKLWRESVFTRDNYTCIWCGQKGGKLNADHIKTFSQFPELRFAIDNGRTLCFECHRKTESWGKSNLK